MMSEDRPVIHRPVVRDQPGHPVAAPCAIRWCQFHEQYRVIEDLLDALDSVDVRYGVLTVWFRGKWLGPRDVREALQKGKA
jgi:hypothetical protein